MDKRAAWLAAILVSVGAGVTTYLVVRRLDNLQSELEMYDYQDTMNNIGDRLSEIRAVISHGGSI